MQRFPGSLSQYTDYLQSINVAYVKMFSSLRPHILRLHVSLLLQSLKELEKRTTIPPVLIEHGGSSGPGQHMKSKYSSIVRNIYCC